MATATDNSSSAAPSTATASTETKSDATPGGEEKKYSRQEINAARQHRSTMAMEPMMAMPLEQLSPTSLVRNAIRRKKISVGGGRAIVSDGGSSSDSELDSDSDGVSRKRRKGKGSNKHKDEDGEDKSASSLRFVRATAPEAVFQLKVRNWSKLTESSIVESETFLIHGKPFRLMMFPYTPSSSRIDSPVYISEAEEGKTGRRKSLFIRLIYMQDIGGGASVDWINDGGAYQAITAPDYTVSRFSGDGSKADFSMAFALDMWTSAAAKHDKPGKHNQNGAASSSPSVQLIETFNRDLRDEGAGEGDMGALRHGGVQVGGGNERKYRHATRIRGVRPVSAWATEEEGEIGGDGLRAKNNNNGWGSYPTALSALDGHEATAVPGAMPDMYSHFSHIMVMRPVRGGGAGSLLSEMRLPKTGFLAHTFSRQKHSYMIELTRMKVVPPPMNISGGDDTLYMQFHFLPLNVLQTHEEFGEHPAALRDDLASLFETGEGADVTVVASDGTEFPVHKTILCARCPVFRQMFSVKMKESESHRIEIDEFSAEPVRALLKYLYSGTLALEQRDRTGNSKSGAALESKSLRYGGAGRGAGGGGVALAGLDEETKSKGSNSSEGTTAAALDVNNWEQAADLFRLADKYSLAALAQLCVYAVRLHISPETSLPTMRLAKMYHKHPGAAELYAMAREYAMRHFDDFVSSLDTDEATAASSKNLTSLAAPSAKDKEEVAPAPARRSTASDSMDGEDFVAAVAAAATASIPPPGMATQYRRLHVDRRMLPFRSNRPTSTTKTVHLT